MRIVTPERWYVAFWASVWILSMVTLYFVVRLAVAHAISVPPGSGAPSGSVFVAKRGRGIESLDGFVPGPRGRSRDARPAK